MTLLPFPEVVVTCPEVAVIDQKVSLASFLP